MAYHNNHRTRSIYSDSGSYSPLKKATGYIDSVCNGPCSPGQRQFFRKKYQL